MIILTFSEKRPALALADYLRSVGIANRVEPADGGFAIVLADPDDAPRALDEAEAFVRDPGNPRYRQASWQAGELQRDLVYDAPPPAAGQGWWRRVGPATRAVALLCLAIFGAMMVDGRGGMAVFGALGFPAGLDSESVAGQWWRLLTPALMHGSLLHLLFNLLWWWEFGGMIERGQSAGRLLALAVVIALVSNAAQFLAYGPQFLGLSAVVYGLLGYLWLYPLVDPAAPFRVPRGIVIFLLAWLAIGYSGLIDALFGIRVSNHGHLAGLVAGAVLGLALGLVNRRRS